MSSDALFIRIGVHPLPVGFVADLSTRFTLLFLVKEIGSETGSIHYQGVVKGNINTVRNFFKKRIGNGNSCYSVKKTTDIENTVQYLCKGVDNKTLPEVIYNDGYMTSELHRKYWDVNKQLTKKKKVVNTLEECWTDIKNELHPEIAPVIIGTHILDWCYQRGCRVPSSFNMGSMIITYKNRLVKESGIALKGNIDHFRQMYPQLGY